MEKEENTAPGDPGSMVELGASAAGTGLNSEAVISGKLDCLVAAAAVNDDEFTGR